MVEIGGCFQSLVRYWCKNFVILFSFSIEILLGPYNKSGVWEGGVLGDVVNEKYPMSLNTWIWNIERETVLDFVPVATEKYVIVTTSKVLKFTTDIYLKPFR